MRETASSAALLAAALLAASSPVSAESARPSGPRWTAGVSAGGAVPVGSALLLDQGGFGPAWGAFVRREFSPLWDAGFSFDHLGMAGDGLYQDSYLGTLGRDFPLGGAWSARAEAGLGLAKAANVREPGAEHYTGLAGFLGGGAEWTVRRDLVLGARLRVSWLKRENKSEHSVYAVSPALYAAYRWAFPAWRWGWESWSQGHLKQPPAPLKTPSGADPEAPVVPKNP